MPQYTTPKVYYERADAGPPGISAVRTDVAGFVGIAERGPVDMPVPVESWRQFRAYFGGFIGSGYLAYAAKAFFENGGRRAYFVRVAALDAASSSIDLLSDSTGRPLFRVSASSPGSWGDVLVVRLHETRTTQALTQGVWDVASARLSSTSGFSRFDLVRVSQPGSPLSELKVVSGIDPHGGRLFWVHPEPGERTRYDRPVESGFDRDRPLLVETITYSLFVEEAGRLLALYQGLSLVPEHDRFGPKVLPALETTLEHAGGSLPTAPNPVAMTDLREDPRDLDRLDSDVSESLPLSGGMDGLRLLTTQDFVGEDVSPRDSDLVKRSKRKGFRALDLVDEVSLIAMPDLHIQPVEIHPHAPPPPCVPDPCFEDLPPAPKPRPRPPMELPPVFSPDEIFQAQDALVHHCELRADRIAVLDSPVAAALEEHQGRYEIVRWRSLFDSHYAALYWPWVRVVDPIGSISSGDGVRDVPPSGHVVGMISATDVGKGVHVAPANGALRWIQDVTLPAGDEIHGSLNSSSINVIRVYANRGIRIMGARTLSSDLQWRFLNVRRLVIMIRKAAYLSMQWAVFEPNDHFTRAKITLSLSSFLQSLWLKGALVGPTADAAHRVQCDEVNNPSEQRDRGRLLAEVRVAPTQPYEFVVIRVGRTNDEIEVSETEMINWAA